MPIAILEPEAAQKVADSKNTPTGVQADSGSTLDELLHNKDLNDNPYKGTPYEGLWNMNPYAKSSYGELSFWDRLGSAMGLRTAHDKYETERLQASREWMAQIESLKQSNEYNSAEEQAQRERDAGLNPAITGDVNAGEGGMMQQDQTPPTVSEPTNPVDLIGGFLSAISTGVNFAQNITGIKEKLGNIDAQDLANANTSIDVSRKMVDLMTANPSMFGGNPLESIPLVNPFKRGSINARRFSENAHAYAQSLDRAKKYWKDFGEYTEGKLTAGLNASNPRYRDSENVAVIADASREYSKALYDNLLAEQRRSFSEHEYTRKYLANMNPVQRAKLDSKQIENLLLEENNANAQLAAVNRAISFLEDKAHNAKTELGRNAAWGSLIALYELRNRTITLPSLQIGKFDTHFHKDK